MPMNRNRLWLVGMIAAVAYGFSVNYLYQAPRKDTSEEMRVVLPRFVQVAMAAGDRYLAANILGFRVLVADTQKMNEDQFKVQARLQTDVAWLNPAHQDNYYIAAAILPWNKQVDAGQYVLRRATAARPTDWAPMFYYAFNLYHFKKDIPGAAHWLLQAAERASDENDAIVLQNLAAKWSERGYQPQNAAQVVRAIANQSRSSGFKKYLLQRAERIATLGKLQEAERIYRERYGHRLERLEQLIGAGLLSSLPVDPFGFGYQLDADGRPMLLNEAAVKNK